MIDLDNLRNPRIFDFLHISLDDDLKNPDSLECLTKLLANLILKDTLIITLPEC